MADRKVMRKVGHQTRVIMPGKGEEQKPSKRVRHAKHPSDRQEGIKKSISAVSYFKHQRQATKKATSEFKTSERNTTKGKDPSGKNQHQDATTHGLSSSPRKAQATDKQREPLKHPFVLEFAEATASYKNHVLKTTIAKVNANHEQLLERLRKASAQFKPNRQTTDPNSSAEHSILERIDKTAKALYGQIGDTKLIYFERDANDQKVRKDILLSTKTGWFEDDSKDIENELNQLHDEWKRVVGEIWKCGKRMLGDEDMASLLEQSSLPSSTTLPVNGGQVAETAAVVTEPSRNSSSLFIPEDTDTNANNNTPDTPCIAGPSRAQKKVAFTLATTPTLPEFLTQPSKLQLPPVGALPEIPTQKVNEMVKTVGKLGESHLTKFKSLEEKHKKWWDAKCKQIEAAMAAE